MVGDTDTVPGVGGPFVVKVTVEEPACWGVWARARHEVDVGGKVPDYPHILLDVQGMAKKQDSIAPPHTPVTPYCWAASWRV